MGGAVAQPILRCYLADNGADVDALMRAAYTAMYHAKDSGRCGNLATSFLPDGARLFMRARILLQRSGTAGDINRLPE